MKLFSSLRIEDKLNQLAYPLWQSTNDELQDVSKEKTTALLHLVDKKLIQKDVFEDSKSLIVKYLRL